MDKDYKLLFAKSILNDVKDIIKRNEYFFDYDEPVVKLHEYIHHGKKQEEVDKKILDVILGLCTEDVDNLEKKYKLIYDDKSKEKSIEILVLYYIALYNDNLNLLHKLLEHNFNFKNHYQRLNLFVLDKRLSKQFELGRYLHLLKNNFDIFYNFYCSLDFKNDVLSDSEAIDRFVSIVKKLDPNDLRDKAFLKQNFLLIKPLFMEYTNEEILRFNDNQRELLNGSFTGREFVDKLVKKYNFDKDLVYWNNYKEDFSESEIIRLTDDNIKAINYMYESLNRYSYIDSVKKDREFAINKIKNILKVNPNYNICLKVIEYKLLTEKQLMKLSNEGANNINWMLWKLSLGEEQYDSFSKAVIPVCSEFIYIKDRIKCNVKKLIKNR